MDPLFTSEQVREADRFTIETLGLSDLILMEHAALAVVRRLRSRFASLLPKTRGLILAGTGNNGGDAIAAARILHQQGCRQLYVVLLGDRENLTPSASKQFHVMDRLGISWATEVNEEMIKSSDWVVDGIFGIGLKRPVEGKFKAVIDAVNRWSRRKWVVSVDVPSGLNADTGMPMGVSIQASETVTLGFLKPGLVTGQAADYTGSLHLRTIQIPRDIPGMEPMALLYGVSDAVLPSRYGSGHKGNYGHLYVHGGTAEKLGAAVLSSRAALRTGTGLVTLIGPRPETLPPEVMTTQWTENFYQKNAGTAMVVGPGFGLGEDHWKRLRKILESPWPVLLDADAITLMSKHRAEAKEVMKSREGRVTVWTPHPLEAARLLDSTSEEVQKDRFAACRTLVQVWGGHFVLKGRGTLVGSIGRPIIVVNQGDSGLSKGGSGDVLTGIIGSLLGQGMDVVRAVPLGIYLHGKASEWWTQKRGHGRSTFPSEVADAIPEVLAELKREWKPLRLKKK